MQCSRTTGGAARVRDRDERIVLLEQRGTERLTVHSPKKGRLPTRSRNLAPEHPKLVIEGRDVPIVGRRTIRGRQLILSYRFKS